MMGTQLHLEWFTNPTILFGFFTLVILEIVLGIDNLIFVAILSDKLPKKQRSKALTIGLSLALIIRLLLLSVISWLTTLTEPVFSFGEKSFSWRDLILISGGVFLLFKSTVELHERIENSNYQDSKPNIYSSFWKIIAQIVVLDIVFSIDSVITAIGMANDLSVMISAVIIAVIIMMVASRPLSKFITKHPTLIILCLGFLFMIGFSLIAEGFGIHIPKGYLYSAMGFSSTIEILNQIIRANKKRS